MVVCNSACRNLRKSKCGPSIIHQDGCHTIVYNYLIIITNYISVWKWKALKMGFRGIQNGWLKSGDISSVITMFARNHTIEKYLRWNANFSKVCRIEHTPPWLPCLTVKGHTPQHLQWWWMVSIVPEILKFLQWAFVDTTFTVWKKLFIYNKIIYV